MGSDIRESARWINPGEPVEIRDFRILGGFFYFGGFLPRLDQSGAENCLVNPYLGISQRNADTAGDYMPYYPSYSEIAPWCRRAYLKWLSGPRNDPASYIGYVFLNLYGLEHCLMLDPDCGYAAAALREVRRLLGVYGSNRSFHYYADALLRAYDSLSRQSSTPRKVLPCRRPALAGKGKWWGAPQSRRRNNLPPGAYVAASGTFEIQVDMSPTPQGKNQLAPILLQDCDQHLHGSSFLQAKDDDIPVRIICGGEVELGSAIPSPPAPTTKTVIDLDKVAAIRSETQNTASILQEIFEDEQESEQTVSPAGEPERSAGAGIDLSGRNRAFLRELLARHEWTRRDFDALAKRVGLMPSAATEAVNDWAYQRFDALLISGDDPVSIDLNLIPKSEVGEAA